MFRITYDPKLAAWVIQVTTFHIFRRINGLEFKTFDEAKAKVEEIGLANAYRDATGPSPVYHGVRA